MTALAQATLKPVRVVKRTTAQADHLRKTFERQHQRSAAALAEVDRNPLAAAVGSMFERTRRFASERHLFAFEDWLDQKRGAGQPLTEGAMAYGDPHWFAARPIAHRTAQTPAFVTFTHGDRGSD